MTNREIGEMENFTCVVPGDERPLERLYCADLLSWAMARAPQDSAWCTVMGNINAVAVASLADVAALIICEGAQPDEDSIKKAGEQDICLCTTSLPAFEAALAIGKKAGLLPTGA